MKFLFLSLLAAAPLASWGLVAVPSVVRARRGVVRPAAAEVWELYLHSLETAPLLTKCATATCIIGAGDAAAQLVEASRGGEPSTGAAGGVRRKRAGRESVLIWWWRRRAWGHVCAAQLGATLENVRSVNGVSTPSNTGVDLQRVRFTAP